MSEKKPSSPLSLAFKIQNAVILFSAVLLLPVAFWFSKGFYNNLFAGNYAYAPEVKDGLYLRMAFDAFELLAVSIFYLMAAFALYGVLLRFFRKEDEDQSYNHAIMRVQTLLGAILFLLLFIPFLLPGEKDGGFYYLLSALVIDIYTYPASESGGRAARVIAIILIALFIISWAFTSVLANMEREKGEFSSLTPKLMDSEKKNRVLGGILLGTGVLFTALPLICFIIGAK